jgi:hypothetical protein
MISERLNLLENSIKFREIFDLYGVNFKNISKHPNLPEDFIDAYFYKLRPFHLEINQTLSAYLINKYQNALNWQLLSKHQNLTEEQIEAHYKFVNWKYISLYQNLSSAFIRKWSRYLDFNNLLYNAKISPDILHITKKYFN